MLRIAGTAIFVLSALPAHAEAPRVLTDVPPVHSLVSRVMQGIGTPDLLVPPGASPHDFALRPSDAGRLAEAEVVIWAGEALTPWLGAPLGTLAPGAARLDLLSTDGWTRLPVREDAAFAHDDDDHEEGHGDDHGDDHGGDHGGDHGHDEAHAEGAADDHAEHAHDDHDAHDDHAPEDDAHDDHAHDHDGTDPHAWLDPAVASVWMTHIAETLAAADPANAAAYAANAAAATGELAAFAAEIDATLAPVRGRTYIVPHDAYQYFETRFDLFAAGAISLTDAATPGPARIAELRDRVSSGNVACVLTDPQTSEDWTAVLREGTEVRTARVDPDAGSLGTGPDLYPAILRKLAASLADCLG